MTRIKRHPTQHKLKTNKQTKLPIIIIMIIIAIINFGRAKIEEEQQSRLRQTQNWQAQTLLKQKKQNLQVFIFG